MNRRGLFNFLRKDQLFVPEVSLEQEEEVEIKNPVGHTRRFFFGIMAGAAAGSVLSPSISEGISLKMVRSYEPGTDLFQLRLDVLYGNKFLTTEMITVEAMKILQNNVLTVKIGKTLNIRRPRAFTGVLA